LGFLRALRQRRSEELGCVRAALRPFYAQDPRRKPAQAVGRVDLEHVGDVLLFEAQAQELL